VGSDLREWRRLTKIASGWPSNRRPAELLRDATDDPRRPGDSSLVYEGTTDHFGLPGSVRRGRFDGKPIRIACGVNSSHVPTRPPWTWRHPPARVSGRAAGSDDHRSRDRSDSSDLDAADGRSRLLLRRLDPRLPSGGCRLQLLDAYSTATAYECLCSRNCRQPGHHAVSSA
jgi:hypothetical protein